VNMNVMMVIQLMEMDDLVLVCLSLGINVLKHYDTKLLNQLLTFLQLLRQTFLQLLLMSLLLTQIIRSSNQHYKLLLEAQMLLILSSIMFTIPKTLQVQQKI
jgi:hypothetical protein